MDAQLADLRGEPGYGEGGRDRAGSVRPAGLVALVGSVPFRQLAGPAAVLLFWPPTRARAPADRRPGRPVPEGPAAFSRARWPGKTWWHQHRIRSAIRAPR